MGPMLLTLVPATWAYSTSRNLPTRRDEAIEANLKVMLTSHGPCDIFSEGGNPCVAAHSTVRALFGAYDGALYQVLRATDKSLLDVKVGSEGGYADTAPQDAFCAEAPCVIRQIYDQSPRMNHLHIAGPGGNVHHEDMGVNATIDPLYVGGHRVYSAYFEGGMGYRQDNTSGMAKGDEAATTYAVFGGTHYNGGCCFDYGNAETDNNDDGAATMEALYFGNATGGLNHGGAGKGPWIMADMEQALWGADVVKSNERPITHEFVTAMIKCDSAPSPPPTPVPTVPGPARVTPGQDICPGRGDISNFATTDGDKCNELCYSVGNCAAYVLTRGRCFLKACAGPIVESEEATLGVIAARVAAAKGHWAIKGGDATAGELEVYWDGPRAPGYSPMKKQGAIILGIGGDNSNRAVGTFYEGAIVQGVPSDATDAAVQANIVAAGYGKK